MDKVILTVATTGSWGSKNDSPYIPLSPEEIAEEVVNCSMAGASLAHIHARDENGNESLSTDIFSDIVGRIKEKNDDLILNMTTAGPPPHENRMIPIKAIKPEMASFDCGSMNWLHKHVFVNSPEFLENLGMCMQKNNIKPEVEIFDSGMMYNALHYIKRGILKSPVHFQFVLGAPGGMKATVKNLLFLQEMLPENSTWSAFGIGKDHLKIMYASLALGATGIRVGMEDNLYYEKGILAKSNVEFVERAVRVIEEFGKKPATPSEAREILNL
ncbi:3-keto-5-aminohexanoate cleavage enzyme [Dethiosulfatibacter aminovorans DSM 17477]|uniref:3-keto-5-aminohexanoate cleavage enzyme n=1 Tax=Dethiosulfatibacter aminovorans DSM 17477 TaxID=1121476 RepID=A0A1M6BYN7_9FIRM|nr:3-keto-5-aminohexanoate cleavage protein [Dethiosulfatibacter aminovorans]SHI53644.1 3-keto-5-aminohexanoate cleavage enzyme [Dethiosulfatibacter aminovorans DSM 17477]